MPTRLQALYANSQRNRKVALNSMLYGWPVDQRKHVELKHKVQRFIDEADRDLKALLADLKDLLARTEAQRKFFDNFNPNSGKQVAELLYDYLEQPVRFRTDQGSPGTGKAALEFVERTGSPEAQRLAKLLRKRKVNAKLQEAYIDGLEGVSLVRPSPHVTAQVGGRWSYQDPALQTIPSFIKPMFIAHPGCWMVACDLAGAEYRTMALQAGCKGMLDAFNNDRDLHKETAAVLFGVPVTEVTDAQRKIAKGVGLGFHYSVLNMEGAAAGLYQQVGHLSKALTMELMLGALQRLARARPEIMEFKAKLWEQAQKLDYVEEPLHKRRRYFYGKPKDTEAYNFPQQAMIAAIMDRAVQGIDAEFRSGEGLHLQRHDEVILGGPDPTRLCSLPWKHMRQEHALGDDRIMFEIEYKLFRRWGEGVVIEPKKHGTEFHVKCPCKWSQVFDTLEEASVEAARHYDTCDVHEGVKR